MHVQNYDDLSGSRVTNSCSKAGQYLDNSIADFLWINTILNFQEYDIAGELPHGVVLCRFLDILDSCV